MEDWNARVEEAEGKLAGEQETWGADEVAERGLETALEQLKEQRSTEEWKVHQNCPASRKVVMKLQTRKLGDRTSGGSRLRYESRPDDIEDDAEQSEEVLPTFDKDGFGYITFWDFFQDRYMWQGPIIEWEQDDDVQYVMSQSEVDGFWSGDGEPSLSAGTSLSGMESVSMKHWNEGQLLRLDSKLDLMALGPAAA